VVEVGLRRVPAGARGFPGFTCDKRREPLHFPREESRADWRVNPAQVSKMPRVNPIKPSEFSGQYPARAAKRPRIGRKMVQLRKKNTAFVPKL